MRKLLILLFLFPLYFSFSQELVLVRFKDKPLSSYYLSSPEEMLTQKSLDRRIKYSINLSSNDVPVHLDYVNSIKDLGIPIIAISRWFNGVFMEINDTQKVQILNLDFVAKIESFVKNSSSDSNTNQYSDISPIYNKTTDVTDMQINQIGLNYLHDQSYTGKNISIAILDAGFPNVNTISAFDYIRGNNQIKGGYNFVYNNDDIYSKNGHGTMVLSTIGGYIPNQYKGTAIDADFYLYITEKDDEEIPQEEVWWIVAAEKADSLGVDIINSSLGYSTFDDSRYNYSISDMDGKTSFIARGAQIASEKGIFVVISAGNEGTSFWKKISTPADAKDVFTVGAVNSIGNSASFSSYGPSADGRIKPDVSALGQYASVIGSSGYISYNNGTSFSSPIIAGAIACLLQAYPNIPPSVLQQKIRESASLYSSPTNQQGYGIPNFNLVLETLDTNEIETDTSFSSYPNPVKDLLHVTLLSDKAGNMEIQFFTYEGRLIYSKEESIQSGKNTISISIPYLLRNHQNLIIKMKTPDGKTFSKKIILTK